MFIEVVRAKDLLITDSIVFEPPVDSDEYFAIKIKKIEQYGDDGTRAFPGETEIYIEGFSRKFCFAWTDKVKIVKRES